MKHFLTSWLAPLRVAAVALVGGLLTLTSCAKFEAPDPAADPQAGSTSQNTIFSGNFVHPGILHGAADLARMRTNVTGNVEPWKSGFDKLAGTASSTTNYASYNYAKLGPGAVIERGTGGADIQNVTKARKDCNAAYYNAVMWAITRDQRHADKAKEILNAWSGTLTGITGADAQLSAAIYGAMFVNAAEILRHTNAGWATGDIDRAEGMFRNVFYPVIRNFNPSANGNWDAAMTKCIMGIGVFLDDATIFNSGVRNFYNQNGSNSNGSLVGYISSTGQCQESARDQGHVQFGIGNLAEVCEIGNNQGMDLYGAENNRLLKGFEYTAKYNLGYSVPYEPYRKLNGSVSTSTSISEIGRGNLRSIYEMVYNHYANRKGLSASAVQYTSQAAAQLRPEGAPFQSDNPGFGTILFSLRSFPGNFLTNPGFEDGTTGWTGRNCALTATTTYKFDGTQSARIESRTQNASGPSQDITSILNTKGQAVYDISARVKKITVSELKYRAKVTVKLRYGGVDHYVNVQENYGSDNWYLISGSVDLRWTGTLEDAEFFVETTDNTYGMLVDQCSLVKTY
ncbi:MAG: alginate lyase family protein [Hymenobacter sp.]|nr:alginate lyase family protein [Hymenobacter sp.]